ncbi:hypothetical protein [Arthrobacter roseus]|uniref:hypothetical protein n=1 Tax=Arthrobacter roseus TaxID=136274 RepID=UPI00196531C8|nr:hypothetical protein [Arthrobacter roseus]MBM7847885.1 hypothetical protein [Arthrobacter roseus]
MRNKKQSDNEDWTARDDALWATAEIGVLLKRGQLHLRVPKAVPFSMQFGGTDERIFAHGPFKLLEWRAPEDGYYMHNSSSFVAVGRGALPAMVGFAAVRAMGNASRRSRARAMAQPQWMQIDQGTLNVGNYGFYMHTPHAILAWDFSSVHLASLAGPSSLNIQGQSATGPVSWVLNSDWAELVFLLWASTCSPTHPQLIGRDWLPEEWLTRAMIHSMTSNGHTGNRSTFQQLMGALG